MRSCVGICTGDAVKGGVPRVVVLWFGFDLGHAWADGTRQSLVSYQGGVLEG